MNNTNLKITGTFDFYLYELKKILDINKLKIFPFLQEWMNNLLNCVSFQIPDSFV